MPVLAFDMTTANHESRRFEFRGKNGSDFYDGFSQLVWDRRLGTAHDWLREEKMRGQAISEIAYLVGFKSSAHFSRMFKARYSLGPREYRNLPAAEGNA